METETAQIEVRHPGESDLDAMAAFEVMIARISFPDDPVVDLEVHKKKLRKALERDREGMFLAVDRSTGEPLGWLWVALNTNFLTEARYANFRSLATANGAPGEVAERLFAQGMQYAKQQGVTELTGKVHVSNVPMRMIYRKFGFEAEHLTMRKVTRSSGS